MCYWVKENQKDISKRTKDNTTHQDLTDNKYGYPGFDNIQASPNKFLTWKRGDEDNVNPSDPGWRARSRPPGVSIASVASNRTSPNEVAWVSGWALS